MVRNIVIGIGIGAFVIFAFPEIGPVRGFFASAGLCVALTMLEVE